MSPRTLIISATVALLVTACGSDTASAPDASTADPPPDTAGVDVEVDSANADESLLAAIQTDDVALARAALEAGADPDGTASVPLVHIAADRGSSEMVMLLVDAGADHEAPGTSNHSALIRAALTGDAEMVQFLIDSGADLDRREDTPGRTIIQLVVDQSGSNDVIGVLLDAGSDIDAVDDRGETALASAAFMGNVDAAELLIERGAVVDTVNNTGVAPIDWAMQRGNDDVATLLADNGATPSADG